VFNHHQKYEAHELRLDFLKTIYQCSKHFLFKFAFLKVTNNEYHKQDGIQKTSGAQKKHNEDETQELIDWVQEKFNEGDPPQRYEIMMKARRILMKNGKVDKLS